MFRGVGDELRIGCFHDSEDKKVIIAVVTEMTTYRQPLFSFVRDRQPKHLVLGDPDLIGYRVNENLNLADCEMLVSLPHARKVH